MNRNTFGLVIPGRAVMVEFEQVDATKLVTTIPNPGQVGEFVFFLIPGFTLPPQTSAVLYYSVDNQDWTVLGAVDENKPSGIFRTPYWSQNSAYRVGVSLESTATVANLQLTDDRRAFARKIAQDLFTFIASFTTTAKQAEQTLMTKNSSDYLVVPANVLDRWIARFDAKYERDPHFYLK